MLFQILDEEGVCKTVMLCWAIWRARNELIWKKRKMTVNEVVALARIELDQWRSAKEKGIMPSFSIPDSRDGAERWSKPDGNTIKVNVDAAIFADSESFGIGWVARDHNGRMIEGGTRTKGGSVSPGVAEAIGVREALSWIKRKGWKEVIVETDCLEVVQAARSKVAMRSYFGSIILECRLLLHELSVVDLIFVRRSANKVAHELARASYLMSDRVVRAGSLPDDIRAVVLDDLSNL